jgi:heavy metal sensor kinase
MSLWGRSLGFRIRLTLWHVAVMVVVVAVYATGVYAFVSRSVSNALDARLRGDFTWAEQMWEQRPDGSLTWFDAEDGSRDEDKPWMQVWDATGQLLFRTAVASRIPVPDSAALAAEADGRIVSLRTPDARVRVLSRMAIIGGKGVVIQVARSEELMRQELRDLMLFLVLGLPFGVAAAGVGGYALARGALAPLDRMADRARSITAVRLHDRLPVDNPRDELGRLAVVFNDTLGRLEGSFQQMQQFSSDVSHELRTPLTAIRMVGEVGLREARNADAYRRIIGSMLEEADRLTCLIDRLLTLSRTSAGSAQLCSESVDLYALADEVSSHLGVLAEEKGQSIVVARDGSPHCAGDRLMLRQALINLVDNAIKYSPADSEILIRVVDGRSGPTVEVSDRGPGISPERRGRIFERGYRGSSGDESRGAGLGLSISKWAVEAHRGQLSWDRRPGGGSTFRITLPGANGHLAAAS